MTYEHVEQLLTAPMGRHCAVAIANKNYWKAVPRQMKFDKTIAFAWTKEADERLIKMKRLRLTHGAISSAIKCSASSVSRRVRKLRERGRL